MTARPRVVVLQTGGTIDHLGHDRLDLTAYTETPNRVRGGLVARIPEALEIAEVDERDHPLRGQALTTADWIGLGRRIQAIAEEPGVAGVVVTRGTNTLEETGFFLDLTLKTDRPIVMTAAMRPPSALSSDGDLNLLNAIRVAASDEAVGLGVLVVMNDAILAARETVKTNTSRVEAFQAPAFGPLGYADGDGRIVLAHAPLRPHTLATEFDVRTLETLPRVDVVLSYIGADGVLVDAAVAAGARGIVSAGLGTGRPTDLEEKALLRAVARGVVVCQASRVGAGRVIRIASIAAKGFIVAGDLPAWQARILLGLALTVTEDRERIQGMFDRY